MESRHPFRVLTTEEYERLTPHEKLDHLHRLMADIAEEAMRVRKAIRDSESQS